MSSNVMISVEGLSKRYRIGARQEGYKTLRETIIDGIRAPLMNLSRLRKLTKFETDSIRTPNRLSSQRDDVVWALHDVSLEVKRGEVVGIIGYNGAGKTTLLKILSRITEPTSGDVKLYGYVSSLLEVGTGFHPELTGRENVFLNGAILGMRKAEIERRFDEIVDFSGVEKFIDTPVKRYSSGMQVRLAFAVAAHLEPEILIVDEVLAVGDVVFQRKCLGKMKDVAVEGRTVLFVSHNMGAVRTLCTRVIMISNGTVLLDGSPDVVIGKYLTTGLVQEGEWVCQSRAEAPGNETARMCAVRVFDRNGQVCTDFSVRDEIWVGMEFWVLQDVSWLDVGLHLRNERGDLIFSSFNDSMDSKLPERSRSAGFYRTTCRVPADLLNNGQVYVRTTLTGETVAHVVQNDIVMFNVGDTSDTGGARGNYRWDWPPAAVRPKLRWTDEQFPLDQAG